MVLKYDNGIKIKTVANPEPRFWLFFTNISPDVTPDDMANLVKSKLNTNDIHVRRLTKYDADLSRQTFVSFKVGIPSTLKNVALSQNTWPAEVAFREFTDYHSQRGFQFTYQPHALHQHQQQPPAPQSPPLIDAQSPILTSSPPHLSSPSSPVSPTLPYNLRSQTINPP